MRKPFDPDAFEKEAMRGVMPFQRATIEAIDRIFHDGGGKAQRRVLVADEVGLGKTIVARGVIGKLARQRLQEEGDDLFKVAYVCSSQNIVRQNLSKLAPGEEYAVDAESGESRLSMQHLLVTEGDAKRKANGETIQLIPITPETSFRLGNRMGTWLERALICAIICSMDEFRSDPWIKYQLSKRLCGNCNLEAWQHTRLPNVRDRIRKAAENSNGLYPANLQEELRRGKMPNPENPAERLSFCEFVHHLRIAKKPEACAAAIGFLRKRFAEISADMLQPDLVILDEFQRFRDLIDPPEGEDGGEVKLLFDRFLGGGAAKDQNAPRVLMLSATPFKLYSTSTECGQKGEDISFREFKGLIDFLFATERERAEVWNQWESYTRFLSAFDVATVGLDSNTDALLEKKARAEMAIRRGICRTERSLAEVPGGQTKHERPATILPESAEIRAWMQFSEWTRALGIDERVRMEYAKSTPYVLSFLAGYKDQQRLENALSKMGSTVLDRKTSPAVRHALWLDCTRVKTYREIPWANARLKQLAEHAFDKGADRLLWIPPTLPCYELGGPFANSAGYSKVLVFSKWQMVPKMASALLSYEAERRTIAKIRREREKLDYFAKSPFPPPRLRFGSGMRSMSLFTLLYPSRALAEAFSPAESLNGGPVTAQEAALRTARRIRRELCEADMPNPKDRPIDERWYYLAPMFLDDAEPHWFADALRHGRGDDSTAAWRHSDALQRELEAGREELGRWPEDLCEVLADIALGSPAVCALRAGFSTKEATHVAGAFQGYFNSPTAIAAVDCSYMRSDEAHWRNVLRYGRDGCLQAVLDEWLHQLDVAGKRDEIIVRQMEDSLSVRSASYRVDTFEALLDWVGGGEGRMKSMRTHFAAAFADGDGNEKDEKAVNRRANLRTAFNSPFRPFVLVSTSIGQEGLDFHGYCRKVFHWNLPHNPVDLEQREGRVDRYRGLAVRQNVAAAFATGKQDFRADLWGELFEMAEEAARGKDGSGLVPNWRNGPGVPWHVERIVPLYACSEDETRYQRLEQLLALFRMALGQPNQEALLDRFLRAVPDPDRLQSLFLNLCPFRQ